MTTTGSGQQADQLRQVSPSLMTSRPRGDALDVRRIAGSLVDQAAVSIAITDREGRIVYANPHFQHVSGYSLTDLLGQTHRLLKSGLTPQEDYQSLWNSILSGRTWSGRITNKDKAGKLYTEELSIFPLRDDDGEIQHFAAVRFDVSRMIQTEASLLQAKQQIERAYQASRKDLERIGEYQATLLPHRYDPMSGLHIVGECRPCADIGGDFYDARRLPDGRVAVYIADVAGHGAIAGLTMATSRALINVSLAEARPGDSAADLVLRASRWMQNQLADEEFATIWLGVWDPEKGILQYCSAAHPPAILARFGEAPVYLPQVQGYPAGLCCIEPEAPLLHEVALGKGDMVILYTDGWIESEASDGSVLGADGFLSLVGNTEGQPLDSVPVMMFFQFERFIANARLRDDLTLLVLERR